MKSFNLTIALLLALALPLLGHAETKIYYVHNDHLGTPQAMTEENQSVVWAGEYGPFGELVSESGTAEQPIRFPGQYEDPETGYYYNYYRDYDPSLGRYIQSDPIGLRGGMNTYGYALQNPVKFIDPDGKLAILAALPFVGGGTASSSAGMAGFLGTGAMLAAATIPGDTPQDKGQKAKERKEYSRICKTPIPPTGDPCTDAKNNLNRLKQCLQLRENFSRKWYNDGDPGHSTEIQNTREAIRKLEQKVKDLCREQCE